MNDVNLPTLHEPTGNSKTDQWGRNLVRWLKSQRLLSVVGGTKQQRPNGYNLIIAARGGGAGSSSQQVTLVAVLGDYLKCKDSTGATIYAAKPQKLRTSILSEVLDGATVTYTITSTTTRTATFSAIDQNTGLPSQITELQVYTPRYLPAVAGGYAGDVITIQSLPKVLNADGSTVKDTDSKDVVWLDGNSDARAWST